MGQPASKARKGKANAAHAAAWADARAAAEPQQLQLMVPHEAPPGRASATVPGEQYAGAKRLHPGGAAFDRNLRVRTSSWLAYLLERYGSPLEGLMRIASLPTHELARELGCTRYEAFSAQLRALSESAPYLHARLATLDVNAPLSTGQQQGHVVLAVAPEMAALIRANSGPDALEVPLLKNLEDQGLSDRRPGEPANAQPANSP